jgi:hypothetical protein
MATRAIVPRGDGEGSLGIETKRWGDIQTDKLNAISMPTNPSISDAGKVLKLNIDATEYEYGVAFPNINIEDEGKVLAIVSGEAAWQIPPTGIPDITEEAENKVLVVREGTTTWLDPLEDLSIGTGYFELTEEGLVTKSMLDLASEINFGTGHFQFTAEGDIKMKSGGDYSVGSTLPANNETDEGKILKISDGSPSWQILPTASSDILGGIKVTAPVTVTDGVLGVSTATPSTPGLMSAVDKVKLDSSLTEDKVRNMIIVWS